jgi:hypothetical protein
MFRLVKGGGCGIINVLCNATHLRIVIVRLKAQVASLVARTSATKPTQVFHLWGGN